MSARLSGRGFVKRASLLGGAALAAGASAHVGPPSACPPAAAPLKGKAIMVGSANSLAGMQKVMPLLKQGSDPLGAVLAAIHVAEDSSA